MSTFNHQPLHPPRNGTVGEGIYLNLWIEFATKHPEEWRNIFDLTGEINQRAATVAASFMVFMGCNGGMSFTHEAERYATNPLFYSVDAAYLAAWAINNRRSRGINHGLRTSEFMLAKRHPISYERTFRFDVVCWCDVPDITQDDNDVLECMVIWWGTQRAKKLRIEAERMIEAKAQELLA